MADLDGHLDRPQAQRPMASPQAVAPDAAPPNPVLTMHQTVGNQAVQRQLRSGLLSRQVVAGLGPMLGNRAVQRLARAGMSQATTGKGPEEEGVNVAGKPAMTGKGPEEEGAVVAGKGATAGSQPSLFRQEIAAFQAKHTQGGLVAQQRQLLGKPTTTPEASPDQSPTVRRKGKDAGTPAGAPVVGKKTVKGPTTQKFGGFSWTVQWELDKPSPKGGWIVQHVDSATDIETGTGTKVDGGYKGLHPIWEAWPVNKGQSVTTYAETGDLDDDTYGHGASAAGTKGEVDVIGSAVFYEGLKLPKSFKVTNAAPTWILPATKSDPGLTGGSAALAHNISAKWDGVNADGTTTVTTV